MNRGVGNVLAVLVAAVCLVLVSVTGCGKKKEGDKAPAAEAKKVGSKEGEREAASPKSAAAPKPLTRAQCDKAVRKHDVECRIKGTPPLKEDEIKMSVDLCTQAHTPMHYDSSGYVSYAQVACLDKDCSKFRDCVEEKERELKAAIKK